MRLSSSLVLNGAALIITTLLSSSVNGYVVVPTSRSSGLATPRFASNHRRIRASSSSSSSPTILYSAIDKEQQFSEQQSSPLSLPTQQQQPNSSATTTTALQMSDTVVEDIAVDSELLLDADKDARINNIALINGVVLASFVASAAYSLAHVQVEALVALWEYDLGPHAPDLTKAAVALDLFARLPVDAVRSYEALVPTNPIFYKACTSGVAYGLGDFISQVYQGRTMSTIDLPRSFRSGAAGFIGHGPLCHYWLQFMETYLDFNGAWWATGIKVRVSYEMHHGMCCDEDSKYTALS